MNILLTSVGRRKYIVEYFQDAFKHEGKVFASNSNYTTAMSIADGYFISPLIYEDNYIDSLIQYCNKNKISIILSLFDIDLYVLAKNESKLKNHGIILILAPVKSIEICNDKWATFKFLQNLDINTPKTFLTINDTLEAINKQTINFPLIIKPRWGMASIGIYKINSEEELKVLYKKCYNEIFDSYLKYESSVTSKNPIVIQEFLKGSEFGLDAINDLKGNFINTYAKCKVSMRAGETDIGETIDNTKFIDFSKKICANINQKGIASIDCIEHNNKIYVIEINCRISGHYPLSHLAGVNYPKMLLIWLKGGKDISQYSSFKQGLKITKDLVPVIINQPLH